MTLDANAAMQALADALAPVRGLNAKPYRVTTPVVGADDLASVQLDPLEPDSIDYQQAMGAGLGGGGGGLGLVHWAIELFVQGSDDAAAYRRMLELLSSGVGQDRSVADALDTARRADRALDPPGVLAGMAVQRATPPTFADQENGGPRLLICLVRGYLLQTRT